MNEQRYTPLGHTIWDPPHGDYYSKPSQPKYQREMTEMQRRQFNLKLETFLHDDARPYFFWLGVHAWGV